MFLFNIFKLQLNYNTSLIMALQLNGVKLMFKVDELVSDSVKCGMLRSNKLHINQSLS